MNNIFVEISAGELIDKITILEIKKMKINDEKKLREINKELILLKESFKKNIKESEKVLTLIKKLKKINLELWEIEEKKREAENKKMFDKEFIMSSRTVNKKNNNRAKVKNEINYFKESNINEVQSHYKS